MDKHTVIATLRAHRAELERLGVRPAALFGSVARDEAGPDSDIDIAVDLGPGAATNMFAYAGLKRQVAELFSGPVDVVYRAALKPAFRKSVDTDLIYAF